MIASFLLFVYSLSCLIAGCIYFMKKGRSIVISIFITAHLASLILSFYLFMYHTAVYQSIIILLLCLMTRIVNGFFIFHHVQPVHLAITTSLFIIIVILQ